MKATQHDMAFFFKRCTAKPTTFMSHYSHCIALHRIASHRVALHCIALHRIASHRIALHCFAVISHVWLFVVALRRKTALETAVNATRRGVEFTADVTAVILHVFLFLVGFRRKHCSRNRLQLDLIRGCLKFKKITKKQLKYIENELKLIKKAPKIEPWGS